MASQAGNFSRLTTPACDGGPYRLRGAPFKTLGVTYQQALLNHIRVALNGVISAADYPEGGQGRIVQGP